MNNLFNPIYRNNYINTPHYPTLPHIQKNSQNISPNFEDKNSNTKLTSEKDPNLINNLTSKSSEKPIFEFHGIKLYTDDILILLLIFFLYKENINDKLLLIALFSLLF